MEPIKEPSNSKLPPIVSTSRPSALPRSTPACHQRIQWHILNIAQPVPDLPKSRRHCNSSNQHAQYQSGNFHSFPPKRQPRPCEKRRHSSSSSKEPLPQLVASKDVSLHTRFKAQQINGPVKRLTQEETTSKEFEERIGGKDPLTSNPVARKYDIYYTPRGKRTMFVLGFCPRLPIIEEESGIQLTNSSPAQIPQSSKPQKHGTKRCHNTEIEPFPSEEDLECLWLFVEVVDGLRDQSTSVDNQTSLLKAAVRLCSQYRPVVVEFCEELFEALRVPLLCIHPDVVKAATWVCSYLVASCIGLDPTHVVQLADHACLALHEWTNYQVVFHLRGLLRQIIESLPLRVFLKWRKACQDNFLSLPSECNVLPGTMLPPGVVPRLNCFPELMCTCFVDPMLCSACYINDDMIPQPSPAEQNCANPCAGLPLETMPPVADDDFICATLSNVVSGCQEPSTSNHCILGLLDIAASLCWNQRKFMATRFWELMSCLEVLFQSAHAEIILKVILVHYFVVSFFSASDPGFFVELIPRIEAHQHTWRNHPMLSIHLRALHQQLQNLTT